MKKLLVVTLASMSLTGCFFGGTDDVSSTGSGPGSGGGSTTATTEVPTSARTAQGFFDYLRSLASDDASEPVVVGDFTSESDDMSEPREF